MRPSLFPPRSVAWGIAIAAATAAAFGQLVGAPWGLAVLTGLSAGACTLILLAVARDGRFNVLGSMTPARRSRPGLQIFANLVILTPALVATSFLELTPASDVTLKVLLLLTGAAAYALGCMIGTLYQLEGDNAVPDPRLHGVTPSPDDRHSTP